MSAPGEESAIVRIVRENIYLAEPTVFLLGFAEGVPFLSWLVPSSAIFLGIGAIHSSLGGQFTQIWLAASLGAVIGDLIAYALGRLWKDRAAGMWPLSRYPEALARTEVLMRRWGVLTMLGGKFLGFMRPFIPVVAGMTRMRAPLFLISSILSSLLWAGAFLAPGYGLGWLVGR